MEIIYEADSWAAQIMLRWRPADHVRKAIEEKRYRASLMEDRLHELISNETLLIDRTMAAG